MSYSVSKANKIATPKYSGINVRKYPSTLDKVSGETNFITYVKKDNPIGRTSGDYFAMSDGNWIKVVFYSTISGRSYGYVQETATTLLPGGDNATADALAQEILDKIVVNDRKLYKNIATVSTLLSKLKDSGKSIDSYSKKLNVVVKSYNNRQNKLKNSLSLKIKQGSESSIDWMLKKIGIGSVEVGVAPAVAIPLAAAALTAVITGTVVYFSMRGDVDDSKVDLNFSQDMIDALNKELGPEKTQEVLKDLNDQTKDWYNEGADDQKSSDTMGTIKTLALIGLGLFIADRFLPKGITSKKQAA